MTVTYRDGSTGSNGTGSPSSHVVTIPGTVQAGDVGLLLMTWVGTAGETPPVVTAAGWITKVSSTTTNNMGVAVLSRVFQTGDGASITVTTDTARFTTWAAAWYAGAGLSAGTVGTLYSRAGVAGNTSSAPSITTITGRTCVALVAERTTATGTTVSLSKGTQRLYLEGSGSATDTALIADFAAAATSSGDLVATYSGSASGNGAGVQVELVEAVQTLLPVSIDTAESFGASVVLSGPVTVAPVPIPSLRFVDTPTVALRRVIRPSTGTTARPTGTTARPTTGTTARPSTGTTARPSTGITPRP